MILALRMLTCFITIQLVIAFVDEKISTYQKKSGEYVPDFVSESMVKSRIQCCEYCSRNDGCLLVSYHGDKGTCRLSNTAPDVFPVDVEWNIYFNSADECDGDPCQNDSTCTDGIGKYTCTCIPGYEGTDCEININECSSSPCNNGGQCNDGINQYSCTCVPGWEGTHCNTDTNECLSNPCMNGGTCHHGTNSYSCTCVPGYVGTRCSIDSDECSSSPCRNGGTCSDGINSYSCACANGWQGARCTTAVCHHR